MRRVWARVRTMRYQVVTIKRDSLPQVFVAVSVNPGAFTLVSFVRALGVAIRAKLIKCLGADAVPPEELPRFFKYLSSVAMVTLQFPFSLAPPGQLRAQGKVRSIQFTNSIAGCSCASALNASTTNFDATISTKVSFSVIYS